MTDLQLYTEIATLPADLKKEVQDFIEFIKTKNSNPVIKERKFGYAKNFFIMQPDFDEPLEDFKEYM